MVSGSPADGGGLTLEVVSPSGANVQPARLGDE